MRDGLTPLAWLPDRPAVPPRKLDPPQIVFTPEQDAEMLAWAREMLDNETKRVRHLQEQVLLNLRRLEHIIQHPPAGRSATNTVVKCLRDYYELAERLAELLDGKTAEADGGGAVGASYIRGKGKRVAAKGKG